MAMQVSPQKSASSCSGTMGRSQGKASRLQGGMYQGVVVVVVLVKRKNDGI